MKAILSFLFLLSLASFNYAQIPKFQLGLESGNNVVFSNIGNLGLVKGQAMVRYSIGMTLRA